MYNERYDFSGWVTKNDLRCTDGVTIRHGAFEDNDGQKVPLVWNHNHSTPANVLGHMVLQNRDEGVYGYGYMNNSTQGRKALDLIQHGDIGYMSIAANRIKRTPNNDVIHGNIYEVSLVYAAANPGAMIDSVISHSDVNGEDEEMATIYTDQLIHAAYYPDDVNNDSESINMLNAIIDALDDDEFEDVVEYAREITGVEDDTVFDNMSQDEAGQIVDFIFDHVEFDDDQYEDGYSDEDYEDEEDSDDEDEYDSEDDESGLEHADNTEEAIMAVLSSLTEADYKDILAHARKMVDDPNIKDEDLMNSLSEDQIEELGDYILGKLDEGEEVEHSDGGYFMRNNLFERNEDYQNVVEIENIMHSMVDDLKQGRNTLKGIEEAYADELLEHGITDIDQLFTVELDTNAPGWIRPEEPSIVASIINALKKTPRHTVHGRWADITEDEARAKGYIKGNEKLEEVFTLLNRRTHPQTVYKKQSFDRDDWVDITDFDLISWVKPEMREMLSYEIARAVLIGDGRASNSADKIDESHIRPIATDTTKNLFAQKVFGVTAATFVETVKRSRRLYRGTGKPNLYIDSELLTEIELIKDGNGRYLYGVGNRPATDEEIAQLVGCDECIAPEFMDGTGLAIRVNLNDYELACPTKGAATMFDDFDIDFNKMKYLIETRVAGALNTPKSAVIYTTAAATYTAVTNPTGNPAKNGWYELSDETYVLTTDRTVDSEKTYYEAA